MANANLCSICDRMGMETGRLGDSATYKAKISEMAAERVMISIFRPKFTESGQWEVEVVDIKAREILYKYFRTEKEAKKYYKKAKRKSKKRF